MSDTRYPKHYDQPWIVCAAWISPDKKVIICGPRHGSDIMYYQMGLHPQYSHKWDSGFIDQFGEFLTREESWTIARWNGQYNRDYDCSLKMLFSEDLY